MKRSSGKLIPSVAGLLLWCGGLSGAVVTLGPDYQRPPQQIPDSFKEQELGLWKQASPQPLGRDSWWELFQDAELNRLMEKAGGSNLDLRAAMARVDQARALARVQRSDLLPQATLGASGSRSRLTDTPAIPFLRGHINNYRVPLDLSYELDIWGRVRRGFESARWDAAASQAHFDTILLSLRADVARTYFSLRSIEAEARLLERGVALRREALELTQARWTAGSGTELDVSRAETEVATTEAEVHELARRRSELEHSLAVLTGEPPSRFGVQPASPDLALHVPMPPPSLPSDLLERRPDVAQAERQLASSNARIGVAKAAFFPAIRLTGNGAFETGDISKLFDWESRAWSLGPSLSLPIFQGGRNRANLARSKAAYEEAVARYQQQVLVAFREVEDALSASHHLAKQTETLERAVRSSRRSAELSETRYKGGLVSYLEVVDSQRTALQAERLAVQLQGQRRNTAVSLIKALGGGWQSF